MTAAVELSALKQHVAKKLMQRCIVNTFTIFIFVS